jgi:DNA-binding transcriptional regulator YiaG
MTNPPTIDQLLDGRRALPRPAERRRIRESAGVPRAVLAADLGVTETALYRWEMGINDPSTRFVGPYADSLRKLSDVIRASDR